MGRKLQLIESEIMLSGYNTILLHDIGLGWLLWKGVEYFINQNKVVLEGFHFYIHPIETDEFSPGAGLVMKSFAIQKSFS